MCGKLCYGFSVNGLIGERNYFFGFFHFSAIYLFGKFHFHSLDLQNMEVQFTILFDLWK